MIVGPYYPQPEPETNEFNDSILHIANTYGYPPSLAKACVDQFDYALMLKNGVVYRFTEAEIINKDWVRIKGTLDAMQMHSESPPDMTFDRGIDMRVSEIAWVADAPNGS